MRGLNERRQSVFEGSPESFDGRNGTVPTNSTEALPGAEPAKGFAKPLPGELGPLVGDEVSGRAETKRGPLNEPAHLAGRGFFPEDFSDKGHAGEDIEYDHELEGKQSKETRDGGDIGHPDVIRTTSPRSSTRLGCSFGNGGLGRFFFEHSPDGAFGDLPTGPTEHLRDLLAATETVKAHGVDEMADDIGVAPDRRLGTDERAHGFLFGVGRDFLLPPGHRVSRDRKELGGFLLGKVKERLELEDLESQVWGVMRPTSFRNLLPALGQDSGDGFVTPCQDGQPSHVGKGDLKGLVGVSVLSELGSTGEAKKSRGLDQSAQGVGVELGVIRQRDEKAFGVRAPLHGGPFL